MAKMAGNKNHKCLLGDVNIDLLKNDIHANTSPFLDLLTINLFVPLLFLQQELTQIPKHKLITYFQIHPMFPNAYQLI